MTGRIPSPLIGRRSILAAGSAATATLFAPAAMSAKPIKIGYVTPKTGPLASFSDADDFVIGQFRESVKNGIRIGSTTHAVEVVVRDSQSNPNRAAEVAKELIVRDQINLMLVSSTPETTNPVSTQCELEDVPCISTMAPWQPYFIGRQRDSGNPASWKPFNSTFHFFWGLEDIIAAFTNMWGQLSTNKVVGGLFPNDADGNAWGDKQNGFPPVLDRLGFRIVDPGRYQNLSDDFTAQIAAFQQAQAEIITGVVIPPDFTTFWAQAAQRGFRPKAASVGKALLYPVALEALGRNGHNLSTEIWWSASHPFKSSMNGATCKQLADGYEQAVRKQWTQQVGFAHSLFEVALDSLKRSGDPTNPRRLIEAISKTDLATIVGHVKFGQDNVPPFARKNVAKTALVGGQWRIDASGKYGLVITDNQTAPAIPLGGKMEALA
jgi:branched-chain amino acid transport system substrate-binding protein